MLPGHQVFSLPLIRRLQSFETNVSASFTGKISHFFQARALGVVFAVY
jgi:hypothetical protein